MIKSLESFPSKYLRPSLPKGSRPKVGVLQRDLRRWHIDGLLHDALGIALPEDDGSTVAQDGPRFHWEGPDGQRAPKERVHQQEEGHHQQNKGGKRPPTRRGAPPFVTEAPDLPLVASPPPRSSSFLVGGLYLSPLVAHPLWGVVFSHAEEETPPTGEGCPPTIWTIPSVMFCSPRWWPSFEPSFSLRVVLLSSLETLLPGHHSFGAPSQFKLHDTK